MKTSEMFTSEDYVEQGNTAGEKPCLRHAAEEALIALAVIKINDAQMPYREIGIALREQVLKAHSLLLSALSLK